MKLRELKLMENTIPPAYTNEGEIVEFLRKTAVLRSSQYEITDDGTVNVFTDVDLDHTLRGFSRLPVNFGKVYGNFTCRNNDLVTLAGMPIFVGEWFNCGRNKITSLDHMPSEINGSLNFEQNSITSLVGIDKVLKKIKGPITFSSFDIKTGGLGLLLVEGITYIDNLTMGRSMPFTIINKYLGKPDELFDCQAELIDMGFEEYAEL